MTNTLHRKGSPQSLKQDFVVFAMPKLNMFSLEELITKLTGFTKICLKYNPINMGKVEDMALRRVDPRNLVAEMEGNIALTAVYDRVDTLASVIKELKEADLGISVNVSGLTTDVHECCQKNGIKRHSVEQSLGVFGKTELLPAREIVEMNSLCGHGLVAFNLIQKVLEEVKLERMTPEEGALQLARPCECGVFNPNRARQLLELLRRKG